jgi:hypothetical protein
VPRPPNSPLPFFVPPQLSQPVEKPPSGPQWVHEIKLDGYRMAAPIDNGEAQLLTRTGLDWTGKYPSIIAALANKVLADLRRRLEPPSRAKSPPAFPENTLRLAARPLARPLGRAGACRRDHIFDVDGRQPLTAHRLCRAAGGQAGRPSAAGVLTTKERLET